MYKKRMLAFVGGVLVVAIIAARAFLMIFVVQPIGALPEGRTVVMWRPDSLHFIESADAICDRKMDGVSLLCRGVVLGAVINNEDNKILLRLPYSRTLYLQSTDGKDFDR